MQKVWGCPNEASAFLLPTIKEQESFEPFGTDNWTWTPLQGSKISSLFCNFSICERFREEPQLRAALPVCIFRCIMISCLRFFEISSEPSVHHYFSRQLSAYRPRHSSSQCVLGQSSIFAYREIRFSDHFLLEWSVVLLFPKAVTQDCENSLWQGYQSGHKHGTITKAGYIKHFVGSVLYIYLFPFSLDSDMPCL